MNKNKFEKVSINQYAIDKNSTVEAVKEEYENIMLPTHATKKSAGYDFHSPIDFVLKPGESIKFPTGIRVSMEDNLFLMCVPRSGLGFKSRLQLDNTVGIVDADYYDSDNEGHIWIKLTNDGREGKDVVVKAGDGIIQGIFMQYFVTVDDNVTAVRNGGFGSTDKRVETIELPIENTPEEFVYEEKPYDDTPEEYVFEEKTYDDSDLMQQQEESDNEQSVCEAVLYTSHCPKCNILQKKLKNKCTPDGRLLSIKICDDPDVIVAETGRMEVPLLKVNGNLMDYLAAVRWVNSLPVSKEGYYDENE